MYESDAPAPTFPVSTEPVAVWERLDEEDGGGSPDDLGGGRSSEAVDDRLVPTSRDVLAPLDMGNALTDKDDGDILCIVIVVEGEATGVCGADPVSVLLPWEISKTLNDSVPPLFVMHMVCAPWESWGESKRGMFWF